MSKPLIVVAGLGRCGTSLVMQMLDAAGVPTTGEWPAFEDDHTNIARFDQAWLDAQAGRAVKIIDPHRLPLRLPDGARVIWLDRNPGEQTLSQIKFATAFMGGPRLTRTDRRAWLSGLLRDRPRAASCVKPPNGRMLRLTFEDILSDPLGNASDIASLLAPDWTLDHAAMVACVRPRGPACLKDFLEVQMLKEGRPGARP